MAHNGELMTVRRDDYLQVADRALDAMAEILRELGDSDANRRPDLASANTPYAIVTHCLGVLEYWVGELVAGRKIQRDRDAEFTAAGRVEDLIGRIEDAKRQLRRDVEVAVPTDPPAREPDPTFVWLSGELTQGAALLHAYEELAQHLGQLELTRDLLRR